MVMLQNTLSRLQMIYNNVTEHTIHVYRLHMIHGNVTEHTISRLHMIYNNVTEHTISRLHMIYGNVTEHTISRLHTIYGNVTEHTLSRLHMIYNNVTKHILSSFLNSRMCGGTVKIPVFEISPGGCVPLVEVCEDLPGWPHHLNTGSRDVQHPLTVTTLLLGILNDQLHTLSEVCKHLGKHKSKHNFKIQIP